jgi:serine/threonine protein kinase
MNPERWQKLDELFQAALECEPGKREAFVAAACEGDDELHGELESMLDHHEQARTFIESPAYALNAETLVHDESETLVGRSLGSYQILNRLGAGAMGEVYLAFEQKLGRKVALKFLHQYLTSDERRVQRFKQEARAASALNHPNILTIFEIGTVDGRHFIATEFVEGETLRELMKRTPMKLREVLDVATQIASALSAAHAAGIVHRDIKPENIMHRPDGYTKIVDFGIAKLIEKTNTAPNSATLIKTETGTVVGTVHYMSPEQVRTLEVDARADIWSFGVVLYEMLTGTFPFKGETAGDMIVSILGSDPLPLLRSAALPGELTRIVNKSLQKDRAKRYQTAEEMLSDLRQVKSRLDAGDRLDTITHQKKRVVLVGVVVALLLVAIAFWAKLWWHPGPRAVASNEVSSAPVVEGERVLNYSLTVQKMHKGRPYDAPFESYGQETFENGWKFRLSFSSPQSGFLYLLHEGLGANRVNGFSMLYPDLSEQDGPASASVQQNPNARTGWFVFDQNPGTEKLWVVWSASPVPELESARRFLNAKDKGFISEPAEARAVQQFVAEHSSAKPQLTRNDLKQTIATTKGDVLVNTLELEHH